MRARILDYLDMDGVKLEPVVREALHRVRHRVAIGMCGTNQARMKHNQ